MQDDPYNPLLQRLNRPKEKQSIAYRKSRKYEKDLAKRVGGRTTLASGSKNEKGDVRIVGISRIEHKCTSHDSFRVTKDMLEKIINAADGCDEIPVIVIEFIKGKNGARVFNDPVACLRLSDLMDLFNAAK